MRSLKIIFLVRQIFVFLVVNLSSSSSVVTSATEDHTGRRVVVVGASYGIGRATADVLADRGAHVVYASRTRTLLEDAIRNKEKEAAGNCHCVVMDAASDESVQRGMEEAADLLGGGIDAVIYCPGYFAPDSYGSFERLFESGDFDEGYEGSINLHLTGMFRSFRYSRKYLLCSNNGCFIALSSVAGSMGHPGAALYAIAKAAVDMSIRQLALDYAPRGLRVLSVAPALIDTPAIDNLGPDKAKFLREVGSTHAMERHGDVSEVAELIAFLCSERASFMTGGPIYCDGGALLRSSLGDALRPFTLAGIQEEGDAATSATSN